MAAVIVATAAQKYDMPSFIRPSYGTDRRLKMLYLEGPKATQSDWFLLTTYGLTATNVIDMQAYTEGTGDGEWDLETITYTSDDAKMTLGHAEVGNTRAIVFYWE